MTKPSTGFPRPLSDLLRKTLSERFAQQGFASTELVTRWTEIAGKDPSGHDIAALCQPMKIQWPRTPDGDEPAPATLVLRVEGPAALEIQHMSAVILERVNRFFGWQAVGRLALRQAPLRRAKARPTVPAPDPEAVARAASALPDIADDDLRNALARLRVAVKPRR